MKYSELFRVLKKNGWIVLRQSGSHVILNHPFKSHRLTVPFHGSKEVKKGLCSNILKQAGIK